MSLLEELSPYRSDVIRWRRDFHMYPELGFQEKRTSGIVRSLLDSFGLEVLTGFCPAETAVIGVLNTGLPGPTVALRADMDALPMQDEKDVPYRSRNDGVCHACGHDGHTAALLGVARYLSRHREGLRGTVKFVFQPAEEGPAPGGAKLILESGALDGVDCMVGAHQSTYTSTGQILGKYGQTCASGDVFDLIVEGRGTHGCSPHEGSDVVLTAAQIVAAWHTVLSRRIDPMQSAVLSVCSVQAGEPGTKNVLPGRAVVSGTVRTFDEGVRERVISCMDSAAGHICAMNGCTCRFERTALYPSFSNDKSVTDTVLEAARAVVGERGVFLAPEPSTGCEDFAWYANAIPASFFMYGVKNEAKGIVYGGHHPKFDLDEDALPVSMAVLIETTKRLLARPERVNA